jgi:membrane-associated HD superfamily phosphohydrolase
MKIKISIALNFLIAISLLVILFQLLILFKFIPYDITWGGRLKTDEQMYVFVSIGILMNGLFIYILLHKGEYIRPIFKDKIITAILWIFFVLFILNTIGNIFAKTYFEKGFSLITGLYSFLLWKINMPLEK